MVRRSRLLLFIPVVCLLLSLVLLPLEQAVAAEDPAQYPTVFVHGYIGWGSYDGLNDVLPYFGLTTGSVVQDLNNQGYHCYAASVGPYSSAWDRACELYAQLTGTRTDYGIAHARKYGHERYGRDFSGNALIPGFVWSPDSKINLVGHSFGGTTIRMMTDLLYDGSAEEVAAARESGSAVSPLFEGGHTGLVHSITTVSTPFNGSTFHVANPLGFSFWPELFRASGTALDYTGTGLYDVMLDQFGIHFDGTLDIQGTLEALAGIGFYDHHDCAVEDLSIERATDMNRDLELRPDIYYFSWYGDKTPEDPILGGVTPAVDMIPTLLPYSWRMCKYAGTTKSSYTDGYGSYQKEVSVPSIPLDEEWQPNDCIVNCISARCPFYLTAEDHKVYDDHVDYSPGMICPKGKWIIHPAQNLDHIGIVGGFLMEDPSEVHGVYQTILSDIHSTEASGSSAGGIEPGCPTAQFADMDHNGWYHTFIDYAVKNGLMTGTSATTFSPEAKVTRGMVVQTLYAMEGKPSASGVPFSDVPSDRYYSSAVAWASQNGVVSGYDDGTFRPEVLITRQQLATILYAYTGYKGKDRSARADLGGYSDVGAVAGYALEPMRWAVGADLMQGRGTDSGIKLCPDDTAMRSELAVVLMKLRESIL